MTVLNNNFNGGPDGTTITTSNSNQYGDQAFDSVFGPGFGGTIQFADAGANGLNRPTAEFAMKLATDGTAGQSVAAAWSSSMGSKSRIWTRFYVYFSSISATTNDRIVFSAFSSGGLTLQMAIYLQTHTTPNCLYVKDKVGSIVTGSTSFVAGVWNRIEADIDFTNGNTTLYVYSDPGTDGEDPADTIIQTGANYGGATCNMFPLGLSVSYSEVTPAYYFSNWQLNDTAFPGPAPFRVGLGVPTGNLTNPVAIICDAS